MTAVLEIAIEQHPGKLMRVIITPRAIGQLRDLLVNIMTPAVKATLHGGHGVKVLDRGYPPPMHGELGPVSFGTAEWRTAYGDRTVFVDVHVDPAGDDSFQFAVEAAAWDPEGKVIVGGTAEVSLQA